MDARARLLLAVALCLVGALLFLRALPLPTTSFWPTVAMEASTSGASMQQRSASARVDPPLGEALLSWGNETAPSCPWTKAPCEKRTEVWRSLAVARRTTMGFVQCHRYPEFFSGAWLATTAMFLGTTYNTGNGVGGAGVVGIHKQMAYKTQAAKDFLIEHLSGLEHNVMDFLKRAGRRHLALNHSRIWMRANEAAQCMIGTMKVEPIRHPYSILALVPYFGGLAVSRGGRFEHVHSFSPIEIRLLHLAATVCSIRRQLGPVVVGVCRDFFNSTDRLAVERIARDRQLSLQAIVELDCVEGHHLPVKLLQLAQQKFRSGEWTANYVYFTEADQLLYVRDVTLVVPFLSPRLYLVPYRFSEWFGRMNPWAGAGGIIQSVHRTLTFGGKKFEAICLCTGHWLNKTLIPTGSPASGNT